MLKASFRVENKYKIKKINPIIGIFFLFLTSSVYANKRCEYSFKELIDLTRNTRWLSQLIVSKQEKLKKETHYPSHIDIQSRPSIEEIWNQPYHIDTPKMLQFLLPEGVQFINHSLPFSPFHHIVKIRDKQGGKSVIARANYQYKKETLWTNVVFSRAALMDNFELGISNHKWLVGTTAKAAVLFLHGGGTRTATAENFTEEINSLYKLGIDGIAIDLPLHGGGSMYIKNIEENILSLAEFVKKYIPPNIPLFIYGHSFGGVFTEKIMQMTTDKNLFPSLKGLITASPPIQDSTLKNFQERANDYNQRFRRDRQERQIAGQKLPEENIHKNLIQKNKLSFLNALYTSIGMSGLDFSIPPDKGKNYTPTVMLVGMYDTLVYMGFKDLFERYYGQLENVKAKHFDREPLLLEKSGKPEKVGHLLANHVDQETYTPIHMKEIINFIMEIFNKDNRSVTLEDLKKNSRNDRINPLVQIAQLWSNDLSFRNWFHHLYFTKNMKFGSQHQKINHKQNIIIDELDNLFFLTHRSRLEINTWIESMGNPQLLKEAVENHASKYLLTKSEKQALSSILFKGFSQIKKNYSFETTVSVKDFIDEFSKINELDDSSKRKLSSILHKVDEIITIKKGQEAINPEEKDLITQLINASKNPAQLNEFFWGIKYRVKSKNLKLVIEISENEKNQLFSILSQNLIADEKILKKIEESKTREDFVSNYSKAVDLNKEEEGMLLELIIRERGKGQIKLNRKKLFKALLLSNSLQDFIIKYPESQLLNKNENKILIAKIEEFLKLSRLLSQTYIPSLTDFYEYTGKDIDIVFSDELNKKFMEQIQSLDNIVQQIKQRREDIKYLEEAITKLSIDVNFLYERAEKEVRFIKESFEKNENNYPTGLEEEYKEAEEALNKVEKNVHDLHDYTELFIEPLLRNQEALNNELVHNHINSNEKLQDLYKDVQDSLNFYKKIIQEVTEQYKLLGLNGHLDPEMSEALKSVYGMDGEKSILLKLEYEIQRVAEMESRKIQSVNDLNELIEQYNRLSPFEATSYISKLNRDAFDLTIDGKSHTEIIKTLQNKNGNLSEIIKIWKHLQSKSPLEAP